MKNRPLISVLMGIYNCAETLEDAVRCIMQQTYTNWELIICDDCSSDKTLEIALQLASKDKRIYVLKNAVNMTLAPSLNKCLSEAHGKYIARMDGDDVCALDRFEKELLFLESHLNYAMVSCQMNLFDADGIYRVVSYKAEPDKIDLVYGTQFCHAGCMIRADVIKEMDGYSIEKYCQRVEDYDLWVRMYGKGYKGYNLQEALYSMRDDRDALKRRNFNNRINECRVKFRACRIFKVPINKYFHVILPIVKWLIPAKLYVILHKKWGDQF